VVHDCPCFALVIETIFPAFLQSNNFKKWGLQPRVYLACTVSTVPKVTEDTEQMRSCSWSQLWHGRRCLHKYSWVFMSMAWTSSHESTESGKVGTWKHGVLRVNGGNGKVSCFKSKQKLWPLPDSPKSPLFMSWLAAGCVTESRWSHYLWMTTLITILCRELILGSCITSVLSE
jgi:hypothetical protein